MWNYNNVQRTVKDLYDWQVSAGGTHYLLSDFFSEADPVNDFWANYRDNHEDYDWYFARRYKSYRYYGQDYDGDNPVEDVYDDFQKEVYMFLMMNDKKYSELYKIELLTTNSPTGDYNITETMTGTKNIDTEYVSGSRQDTSTDNIGQATTTETESTKAYNSAQFLEVGKNDTVANAKTDSTTLNKGQQTDTEDKDYTEGHTIITTGTKDNPSENLEKFKRVWKGFSFYSMIFDDICKNLLLV